MRIFVAGATGVLGRTSIRHLMAAGHTLRGTARTEDKAEVVRKLGAEPVAVDLFDPQAVRRAVDGCDAVLHLATKIPPLARMRSLHAWDENDRLRTEAARILVDAALAAGASLFLQESISFVYAGHGDEWIDEDGKLDVSRSPYLSSALDAERETARFAAGGGRGVSLRFASFYAPYALSTLDSARYARRHFLFYVGAGDNYYTCLHVDDAARAVAAALNLPSGIYNVAEDEPSRMRDYTLAITGALNAKPAWSVPAWMARIGGGKAVNLLMVSHRISNARFKEATGWAPQYRNVFQGWQSMAPALLSQFATKEHTMTTSKVG